MSVGLSGVLNHPRSTYARPSRCYASDGTTLKQLNHVNATGGVLYSYTAQDAAADGDRLQTFLTANGTETKLSVGLFTEDVGGIFDLYINDVLDSSTYDTYSVASGVLNLYISLSAGVLPIRVGENKIEFRVNDNNVGSSDFYIEVGGVSIQ